MKSIVKCTQNNCPAGPEKEQTYTEFLTHLKECINVQNDKGWKT